MMEYFGIGGIHMYQIVQSYSLLDSANGSPGFCLQPITRCSQMTSNMYKFTLGQLLASNLFINVVAVRMSLARYLCGEAI